MDQRLQPMSADDSDEPRADDARGNAGLHDLLQVLRRRKWLLLALVALVTGLAALFAFTQPPRYTATLQILFESRVGPVFDFESAVRGVPQDEAAILSEIQVLRSRVLAERVIDKLQLDSNPLFLTEPQNPLLAWVREQLPVSWLLALGGSGAETPTLTEERRRAIARQKLIDRLVGRIDVKQIPRSRTVEVRFTAADAELAADTLNTLAETYVLARLEDRFQNAQRASAWLAERVQKLKDRVEESEQAVEDYRRSHNLFQSRSETLISQRIADLNGRLTQATIERRAAEANLAEVRRLLTGAAAIEAAPQVLQSALIQRFREEELGLERQEADKSQVFGPAHPAMVQLRAEKQRVRDRLREEIGKIASSLENELQIVRGREKALRGDLQTVKVDMAQANDATVGLRTLEREADANRLLIEKFLATFMETSAQEDVKSQVADARIISLAAVPLQPSFPKKPLLIGLALLASMVLGLLLVFGLEQFDAGFRSADQVEMLLGLPVLAHLPLISRRRSAREDVAGYVLKRPLSAYAEAIHALHTRLVLSFSDRPAKVIAFISALPSEGKTTTTLSLARQQARSGRRVIIVDSDFRRSPLARATGIAAEPGLSDLLAGRAGLAEVTQTDPLSTAHIIVASQQPLDSFALDETGRFQALLADLRDRYDLVLLDAPPLLSMADANVIAASADITLVVVRWGKTPRRAVQYVVRNLSRYGGRVHGVILSMIDVKQHATYGFGDSGYYYGGAKKYYLG